MLKIHPVLLVEICLLVSVSSYMTSTYFDYLQSRKGIFGDDPETRENATQIIQRVGFDAEEHEVKTADGYILCLIRMRNLGIQPNGKVVFLQHGLLDSAHTWINNLRNESLGFILADAGFDVWLGNSRGSTYSRKHDVYNPREMEYWEFSWDQMAAFDLPSSLYHVLMITGAKNISYIGHSQGTQIAFAQFSRDPELQSRINLFIALAPVAYLGNVISPIRYVAPFAQTLEHVWDLFGHGEFLPSTRLLKFLAHFLCGRGRIPLICSNVIYLFAGYDEKNTNTSRLPIYISHTPAGTSAQNMVHYCQSIKSNQFQQYDYGRWKNLQIYGRETPLTYNLSRITVPTAIFHGGSDWLSVQRDVDRLVEQIKPAVVAKTYLENYNHLDFVWGLDSGTILYPEVVKLLNQY